jgi:hypothetical protein
VYSPPRELLQVLPGAEYVEMERSAERSFCCGAGGARMWMEERIGERINENRTREAVATGADQIAVGCPFCRVMLDDGLTAQQSRGEAREEVEVLDVAQMLLASVKRPEAPAAPADAAPEEPVETKAEPEEGDVTQTADTVSDHQDVGADAGAAAEPDPEIEASHPEQDQPGADSEPATNGPATDPPAKKPTQKPVEEQDRLF